MLDPRGRARQISTHATGTRTTAASKRLSCRTPSKAILTLRQQHSNSTRNSNRHSSAHKGDAAGSAPTSGRDPQPQHQGGAVESFLLACSELPVHQGNQIKPSDAVSAVLKRINHDMKEVEEDLHLPGQFCRAWRLSGGNEAWPQCWSCGTAQRACPAA